MRGHLCFVVFIAVFVASAAFRAGSVQVGGEAGQGPRFNAGPVTDYKTAVPDERDVLRLRRGRRYDIENPNLDEISENSPPVILDLPGSHSGYDATPFDRSDAVVIAAVGSGQAYLSSDRRAIYSEFHATVEEVLKTQPNPYLRAGDAIDLQRSGGALKFPSGKILLRGSASDSMPVAGGLYVFFLKYNPDTADYHIDVGHLLQDGKVYRLDHYPPGDGQGKVRALEAESGSGTDFVARIKATPKERSK